MSTHTVGWPCFSPSRVPCASQEAMLLLTAWGSQPALGGKQPKGRGCPLSPEAQPAWRSRCGVTLTSYQLKAEQKGGKELAYRHRKGQNRTLTKSNPT